MSAVSRFRHGSFAACALKRACYDSSTYHAIAFEYILHDQRRMRFLERFRASPLFVPLAVFAIGVAGSVLAAVQVAQIARAKDQERFANAVAQARSSITARLDTYIAMLRAGAGLLAATDGAIDRGAFGRYVQQLQLTEHYPGVQGIGFSARLPGHSTQAASAALKQFGVADLKLYPEGESDEIHAIVHLEPLDRRNLAALGYDMYSESVRRAAMIRARDNGRPAASGRVQLVQEIDERKQAGFLIYMPVYRGGLIPATVTERRERLLGFVYSTFRADDLMRGIFGTDQPRLGIHLYDGDSNPENSLHRSIPAADTPRFTATESLG